MSAAPKQCHYFTLWIKRSSLTARKSDRTCSCTHTSRNISIRWKWYNVKNILFRRSKPPVSVSAMVSDLGWESLQSRRLHGRLTMMNKITNGLVEVPQEYHPVPRLPNSARGHPRQFSNLPLTHLSMRFFLGPFQPGTLFHKQLLRWTGLIYSSNIWADISSSDYLHPAPCT